MKIPLLIFVGALSGCSSLTRVTDRAADAYDEARLSAEFTMCRAISIGAWVRAYGGDKDRADAWKAICHPEITELPVTR